MCRISWEEGAQRNEEKLCWVLFLLTEPELLFAIRKQWVLKEQWWAKSLGSLFKCLLPFALSWTLMLKMAARMMNIALIFLYLMSKVGSVCRSQEVERNTFIQRLLCSCKNEIYMCKRGSIVKKLPTWLFHNGKVFIVNMRKTIARGIWKCLEENRRTTGFTCWGYLREKGI